ncbi:hypothetical protein AGOR_G00196570 [Albula goreensis]|uniref:Uncharacterized protein n=1 Tax=Albula goreensis TaxID=1534307 RepID=A0A8T3CS20_9TELE|nr:hypothetical protein AGOR_G00196570 [Albula goreensis]
MGGRNEITLVRRSVRFAYDVIDVVRAVCSGFGERKIRAHTDNQLKKVCSPPPGLCLKYVDCDWLSFFVSVTRDWPSASPAPPVIGRLPRLRHP